MSNVEKLAGFVLVLLKTIVALVAVMAVSMFLIGFLGGG